LTAPCRRWAAWIAGLVCLAWSFAGVASDAVFRLGGEGRQPLGAYLGLFEDTAGALDLAGAMAAYAAGKFQPSPSSVPNLGHRPGATWVRFSLANPTASPQERWLEVNWVFQQSYVLYLVDDAGGHHERMESGARIPIAERPLPSRRMLFPVRLEPGEHKTAYLRIAGRSMTVVDLTVWRPAVYLDNLSLSKALKYMGIGATAIVIVFSILAWRARRRPGLLALIPGHVATVLVSFWTDGFAEDWIAADDSFWYSRSLFSVVFLISLCHIVFARAFLELAEHAPRWDWIMRLLGGVCILLAIAPLFPAIHIAPVLRSYVQITVTGCLTWTALAAARRKGTSEFGYLAAWGGLWLAAMLRTIQGLGWLSETISVPELWLFVLMGSAVAMTYVLYLEVEAVKFASQDVQARLKDLEQNEFERLTRAVGERTEQLMVAMERAEAANRAKSAFLSTVSHEFRTPLHTILGYAHLLGRRAGSEFSHQLAAIEKSGAQLLRLIDEVLDFSRGESKSIALHPEPVSLPSLVRHLEDTGCLLAEKNGNRFSVELGPGLPEAVEADGQRLTQVLLNLIGNACKYTQRGAVRLSIADGGASMKEGASQEDEAMPWRCLRFEVEDNGVGIALADQMRIFEPFSRGAGGERQPGVGLGLAIARQLVRAMGGDIELDSEPGRGSRFYFALRLREIEAEAPFKARPLRGRIAGYQGPPLTLLVVDDIVLNRMFLQSLCAAWGFTVILAADGEEAIACCRTADSPIDAVLVDQFMPRVDGWDFLRRLRRIPAFASLPVVLVSAAPPERPLDFPADLDFDGVLLKPVTPGRLADVLKPLLGIEWQREPPPGAPTEAGQCIAPPADKLAEFRTMLELGQVIALRRWADAVAVSHPECAEFANQVQRLSQSVDLQGLQRLLEQAASALPPPRMQA
jgi:signal transduction histidine kinase/CheY-like chemotaxis protein